MTSTDDASPVTNTAQGTPPPGPEKRANTEDLKLKEQDNHTQTHSEPGQEQQESQQSPALRANKPGKTARRTARRRAREAAERAAAATAGEGVAANSHAGAGDVVAPSRKSEENTLDVFEEGEEDDPFNVMIPLPVRVETAGQAFVRKGKKRRISIRQEALLRTFLRHGGIKLQKTAPPKKTDDEEVVELDDVPSMEPVDFSDDEGEECDQNEMSNQKVVDSDDSDEESDEDEGIRQVDFFGVTSSYLSVYILGPESQFVEMEDIREAPHVCEAFLNYLLVRKAAPEYDGEIRKSIELCKQATEELPRCKELSCLFPGKFNMACSIRFGGEYYQWLDLRPEDAFSDDKVTTVEGVKIFQAPDVSQYKDVEGWGPPPKVDSAEAKKKNKKQTAEDWDQEGETESVLGVTRHEVVKFTSRFYPFTEDVPKPERHYTLARVVRVSDPAKVQPSSSEAPIPGANMLAAREAFFPASLKFVESAEDDPEDSEGLVVQVYFDQAATEKLCKGMLLEAAFYKLHSGHWYIGQVAYVLPSFTKEDFE